MSDEINRSLWEKCSICNKSLKDIKTEIGGNGVYFSYAFKEHLSNSHGLSLNQYFFDNLKLERKKCPCGVCDKDLSIMCFGAKITYRNMACGRNEGVKKWAEEAKESRKGANNPMFGKDAWNSGKTKEDCEQLKKISEAMTGRIVSEETKHRQSESAKVRLIHGHTGIKHSQETKDFLRANTLRLIKEGVFKQTITKPHLIFRSILDELDIKYEEETTFGYFSFDFYLFELDMYVEIDGDYFHSNPRSYPNGPVTKTQKVNDANDRRKNTFMKTSGKTLMRFWECDVLNGREDIICKLKELIQSSGLGKREL